MPFSRQQAVATLMAALMFSSPLWACQLATPSAKATPPQTTSAPDMAPQPIAAQANVIELTYVPETAVSAVLAQPARVLSSPEMTLAPVEVLQAALVEQFGLDPLDVAQVLVVFDLPNENDPDPPPGVVVRFVRDYTLEDLFKQQRPEMEEAERDGRPVLVLQRYPNPNFFMPDDRTLLIAHEELLNRMLAQDEPADTRVVELLTAAGDEHDILTVTDVEKLRPLAQQLKDEAPPLPQPLAQLLELPELLEGAQIQINLTGGRASQIELLAADEDSAEQAEDILNNALGFGCGYLLAELEQRFAESEDPVEQALYSYSERLSRDVLDTVTPVRDGKSLSVTYQPGENPQAAMTAGMGVLVALLLPAINAAQEAARRNQALNQIRQLGIALIIHEGATGRFPSAGGDEESRPGLSWRVHILPHIEQEALYEQFHLDEPWDSEHNKALIERMPAIFHSPTIEHDEPGYTHYQLIVGEGTAFTGGRGPRVRDLQDGVSMTALLVEADTPVIWTKPDDWEFDPEDPFHDLGHLHVGRKFFACFFDVHTMLITIDGDPENFAAACTHQGGEPYDHDALVTGE